MRKKSVQRGNIAREVDLIKNILFLFIYKPLVDYSAILLKWSRFYTAVGDQREFLSEDTKKSKNESAKISV
jgi:hypothetical protein